MSVIRRQKRRTRLKRTKSFNHPQRLVTYGTRSAQVRSFHRTVGQVFVRSLSRPFPTAEFMEKMRKLVADIQEGVRIGAERAIAVPVNIPTARVFYIDLPKYENAS